MPVFVVAVRKQARRREAPAFTLKRAAALFSALLASAFVTAATGPAAAGSLAKGMKAYKAFAIERIGAALAGAKDMQAAVKAGDAKAAQAAWIKSRRGWESVEPISGEFFSDLDSAIDSWPDAKQGYHAIEAALFAGKLTEIAGPVDRIVVDLTAFDRQLRGPKFSFTPQGLLNGATKLAYEIGENKAKGGESPYAGTSLVDMRENVEGIEALYNLVFRDALTKRDAKLAAQIVDKIANVAKLVGAKDLKSLDQAALRTAGEELAVLLQAAAPKLKLQKPKFGEDAT